MIDLIFYVFYSLLFLYAILYDQVRIWILERRNKTFTLTVAGGIPQFKKGDILKGSFGGKMKVLKTETRSEHSVTVTVKKMK